MILLMYIWAGVTIAFLAGAILIENGSPKKQIINALPLFALVWPAVLIIAIFIYHKEDI